MIWYIYAGIGIIGMIIGSIISNIIFYLRSGYGILKIDETNPEKDMYKFIIDDLKKLKKKKRMILKIFRKNNNDYYGT